MANASIILEKSNDEVPTYEKKLPTGIICVKISIKATTNNAK